MWWVTCLAHAMVWDLRGPGKWPRVVHIDRGRTTHLVSEIKSMAVPSQSKLTTGDMQEGPSPTLTDNAVVNVPHVSSQVTNDNLINIYLV
jgi:hypothetical protein